MKIVFLCGSLEPGRDGVGDYIRRLACELCRKGHLIKAIALNDQYIPSAITETQSENEISLSVLRLPSTLSTSDKFQKAREWINLFNPDWLSLQYVIFSFHKKGLPFGLEKDLASLSREGRNWHIMFHELWLGLSVNSPKKIIIWGYLQKIIIKRLVKVLEPKVIHTQSSLYNSLLSRAGIKSIHLPLFGNIPVIEKSRGNIESGDIIVVLFGMIHPGINIKPIVEEAAMYSKINETKVKLVMMGRNGTQQENWSSSWKLHGLPVEVMGEQPVEKISQILHNASLGITTSKLEIIEKSGTVAAMIEHRLPVLCVADSWILKSVKTLPPPDGVYEYFHGALERLLAKKVILNPPKNGLPEVSDKLIKDLVAYHNLCQSNI